jgi:hypothetical protein
VVGSEVNKSPCQRRLLIVTTVTHRFATSLVMKVAYGYRILSDDDEYIKIAGNAPLAVAGSGLPGTTPPDLLPICAFSAAMGVAGRSCS